MKRNKKTEVVANGRLTPLTDKILAKMGPEGTGIRQRLKRFYQERVVSQTDQSEQERGTSG
jgi:hypothetical protein